MTILQKLLKKLPVPVILNRREQYAVIGAGVCILIFVIVQFIAGPIIEKKERLERTLNAKRVALDEILVLKAEYNNLTKDIEKSKSRLTRRKRGFTLFSFMDQLAGDAGIKNRIAYMKPSTTTRRNSPYKLSTVELKLEEITMKQLLSYLYRVETSKNLVSVRRISITKADKTEGLLNSIVQVETIQL